MRSCPGSGRQGRPTRSAPRSDRPAHTRRAWLPRPPRRAQRWRFGQSDATRPRRVPVRDARASRSRPGASRCSTLQPFPLCRLSRLAPVLPSSDHYRSDAERVMTRSGHDAHRNQWPGEQSRVVMQVSGFGRSVAACVPAEGYRIPAPSRSARRRSLAKSASGRVRKPTGICAAEPNRSASSRSSARLSLLTSADGCGHQTLISASGAGSTASNLEYPDDSLRRCLGTRRGRYAGFLKLCASVDPRPVMSLPAQYEGEIS